MWELKITLGRTSTTDPVPRSSSRPTGVPDTWWAEARRVWQLTRASGDTRPAREALSGLLKSASIFSGRSVEELRSELAGVPTPPPTPVTVHDLPVVETLEPGLLVVEREREALSPGHQRVAGTGPEEVPPSPWSGLEAQAKLSLERVEHDLEHGFMVLVDGDPFPADVGNKILSGELVLVNGVGVSPDEVEEHVSYLRKVGVDTIEFGYGDNKTVEHFPVWAEPEAPKVSLADLPLETRLPRRELASESLGFTVRRETND